MKLKISLINLLQIIGFAIVGFVVLAANTSDVEILNGFNTMYIGLGFLALALVLTYLTTKDNLSGLVNLIGTFLIILVALPMALVDANYLYALAAMGGITVIYAIALVSLSFRAKE